MRLAIVSVREQRQQRALIRTDHLRDSGPDFFVTLAQRLKEERPTLHLIRREHEHRQAVLALDLTGACEDSGAAGTHDAVAPSYSGQCGQEALAIRSMLHRKKNYHSVGLRDSRLGHRFESGLLSRPLRRWVRGLPDSGTNHDA